MSRLIFADEQAFACVMTDNGLRLWSLPPLLARSGQSIDCLNQKVIDRRGLKMGDSSPSATMQDNLKRLTEKVLIWHTKFLYSIRP